MSKDIVGTMAARDGVQRVAAALDRPHAGYVRRLDRARGALTGQSGEAARLLGVFIDRVRDLTTEELCELYDETFRRNGAEGPMRLAARLAHQPASGADARAALATLTLLLPRLEADRNPFAYVVKALCCLLLNRVPPRPWSPARDEAP